MVSSESIHLACVTVKLWHIIFLHEQRGVCNEAAAQEMGGNAVYYWPGPLTGHFHLTVPSSPQHDKICHDWSCFKDEKIRCAEA